MISSEQVKSKLGVGLLPTPLSQCYDIERFFYSPNSDYNELDIITSTDTTTIQGDRPSLGYSTVAHTIDRRLSTSSRSRDLLPIILRPSTEDPTEQLARALSTRLLVELLSYPNDLEGATNTQQNIIAQAIANNVPRYKSLLQVALSSGPESAISNLLPHLANLPGPVSLATIRNSSTYKRIFNHSPSKKIERQSLISAISEYKKPSITIDASGDTKLKELYQLIEIAVQVDPINTKVVGPERVVGDILTGYARNIVWNTKSLEGMVQNGLNETSGGKINSLWSLWELSRRGQKDSPEMLLINKMLELDLPYPSILVNAVNNLIITAAQNNSPHITEQMVNKELAKITN